MRGRRRHADATSMNRQAVETDFTFMISMRVGKLAFCWLCLKFILASGGFQQHGSGTGRSICCTVPRKPQHAPLPSYWMYVEATRRNLMLPDRPAPWSFHIFHDLLLVSAVCCPVFVSTHSMCVSIYHSNFLLIGTSTYVCGLLNQIPSMLVNMYICFYVIRSTTSFYTCCLFPDSIHLLSRTDDMLLIYFVQMSWPIIFSPACVSNAFTSAIQKIVTHKWTSSKETLSGLPRMCQGWIKGFTFFSD